MSATELFLTPFPDETSTPASNLQLPSLSWQHFVSEQRSLNFYPDWYPKLAFQSNYTSKPINYFSLLTTSKSSHNSLWSESILHSHSNYYLIEAWDLDLTLALHLTVVLFLIMIPLTSIVISLRIFYEAFLINLSIWPIFLLVRVNLHLFVMLLFRLRLFYPRIIAAFLSMPRFIITAF